MELAQLGGWLGESSVRHYPVEPGKLIEPGQIQLASLLLATANLAVRVNQNNAACREKSFNENMTSVALALMLCSCSRLTIGRISKWKSENIRAVSQR